MGDINLEALAYFAWGTDPMRFYSPLPLFKPTGEKQSVEGHECLVYSLPRGKMSTRLLVDPALDYSVRRIAFIKDGKLSWQSDVTYGALDGLSVFPTRWTVSFFNAAGKLTETRTMSVQVARIPESVRDAEFEIAFPPGTLLMDKRIDKMFDVKEEGALVPSEMYYGPQGSSRAADSTQAWVWVAIAACVLSALLYVWLSWKRKPLQTQ